MEGKGRKGKGRGRKNEGREREEKEGNFKSTLREMVQWLRDIASLPEDQRPKFSFSHPCWVAHNHL